MNSRLAGQSSPYLLQHAQNPVDWFPWCDEAFTKADKEDKPVFLSIGYSTCHWCHVMAHESFEDKETAEILNRHFVSIKVDREERPDIDSVYMSVCQAFTGNGGWPMSIFMTPHQEPFFAGTYFPPDSRYGMIGFKELLLTIAAQWKQSREKLLESAGQIISALHNRTGPTGSTGSTNKTDSMDSAGTSDSSNSTDSAGTSSSSDSSNNAGTSNSTDNLNSSDNTDSTDSTDSSDGSSSSDSSGSSDSRILDILPAQAAEIFSQSFDAQNGGFGAAPKFPAPHNLLFLILYSQINQAGAAWKQAETTLEKMRRGGIFDQIGFGFSRYSTDERYLVPHFEKMLYDNALLILAYCAAYKASGRRDFLRTAEQAAEYVLREMTGENGEFYSAQDADSDGEEGKYYVWKYEEICEILGSEKGALFCRHFGMTKQGNFEGRNIPNLLHGSGISDDFEAERKILYDYRRQRASLHLDDKVLTSWNALMISAMAVLYRVTGRQLYLSAAENAQKFIDKNLTDGRLLYVSWRGGVRSVKGFLDDYAYETAALISLYEVSGSPSYLKQAELFCQEAQKQFADDGMDTKQSEPSGGYFLYGMQNSRLITRPKESYDGAMPSGNSIMAYCLVRLSQLTADNMYQQAAQHPFTPDDLCQQAAQHPFTMDDTYQQAAQRQLAFMSAEASHYPAGYSMFLTALLYYANPPQKITVVLSETDAAGSLLPKLPLFADIRMLCQPASGYQRLNGRTTFYVCRNHACLPPTNHLPE